jgi:aspartyl-tRNA(Asn)/glutamyl-tRNA(Gln) amidotransferase subunit A
MDITELTVHELLEKIEKKEITSLEIVQSYLNRIEEKENEVQAFLGIDKEKAIKQATENNSAIPIAVKDNMNVLGMKTTCASKILENFVSPYNATVIEKLEENNSIVFGKLNMDEFAMGASTEYSAVKKTRNPWNLNKVPGGSSGGSAAAVAADMVPWALGSDTGGSIRQPASFCGVVGLKPTYGLVSRYGLVAFASSLDQIGPITKDVTDCSILLNMIAGHDPKDSTSAKVEKVDYTKSLKKDVKGLRIGVPKEYFGEGINEEVKKAVLDVAKKYEEMGAIVEECSISVADYALAVYYIIACAEASSNLGRFDGIRYGYRTKDFNNLKDIYRNSRSEGFGPEVKRRIILGTYVLSSGYYDAYYKKAQKVRTVVKQEFAKLFEKYDVLLTPTAPTVAFDIGTKSNNPLEMYLADICTVSINIAGVPAISVPCTVDKENMPIGFQLIGKHFGEETLLRAAYTYEQENGFRQKYKPTFKK